MVLILYPLFSVSSVNYTVSDHSGICTHVAFSFHKGNFFVLTTKIIDCFLLIYQVISGHFQDIKTIMSLMVN